jgi:hypothetical protein
MSAFWFVVGWLCIGATTTAVVTVWIDRYRRSLGETWSEQEKHNMLLLAATIAVAWPGFYVFLLLFAVPRTRALLIHLTETGKFK